MDIIIKLILGFFNGFCFAVMGVYLINAMMYGSRGPIYARHAKKYCKHSDLIGLIIFLLVGSCTAYSL